MSSLLHQSISNVNSRILRYVFGGYKATVIVIAVIILEVLTLRYLADLAPVMWSIEPGIVLPLVVLPGLALIVIQLLYILTIRDELITLQARAAEAIAIGAESA